MNKWIKFDYQEWITGKFKLKEFDKYNIYSHRDYIYILCTSNLANRFIIARPDIELSARYEELNERGNLLFSYRDRKSGKSDIFKTLTRGNIDHEDVTHYIYLNSIVPPENDEHELEELFTKKEVLEMISNMIKRELYE